MEEERDTAGLMLSFVPLLNATREGLRAGSIVTARASSICPALLRIVRPDVFERFDNSELLQDISREDFSYGVLDLDSFGKSVFRTTRLSSVFGMVI